MEKLLLTLESRRSLELPLARLLVGGEISVFSHVEAKGLLYLQFRKGCVTLTAGRYVGLIPLTPTITVDVQPKLPVNNLARVLDRARVSIEALRGVDRLYLAAGSPSNSVLEFLLWNLLNSLQPVRESGILKEYVRRSAMATHPRGRIRVSASIQACRARGIRHQVIAERFEQTTDLAANRVLRAALVYLLSALRHADRDRDLIRLANEAYNEFPEQIGSMKAADYEQTKLAVGSRTLPLQRSYYYRALEIALLALSGRAISLEKLGVDLTLDTFIVDFEDVFERYLRRTLQHLLNSDLIVHNGNEEGKRPLFDDRIDPPAQPDIVIKSPDTNEIVVLEVKYKEKPDRSDINQAITYGVAYRSKRVVLVHQCRPAATPGLRSLGRISGIQVDAYAFDLGRTELEAEEAAFVGAIREMFTPPA